MRRRESITLAVIILIASVAGWIVWPDNPGIHGTVFGRDIDIDFRVVEGLDLQGGLQVLLEADPAPGQELTPETMNAARSVIEQRINAFGTTEPVIQLQGQRRIVVEMPGVKTPEERERAVKLFGETGLLEFVDTGSTSPPPGRPLEPGKYPTVLTGKNVDASAVSVTFDQRNTPQIAFGWDAEGARTFGDYTEKNVGKYLTIVLDGVVLSAPRINSRIEDRGVITGRFSLAEAKDIVTKLKYGALPVPVKVVQQREIGATLGQDSVDRSIMAGAVGLGVVLAYMLIYYRLPGFIAGLALVIYSLLSFAAFKNPWAPVTLTLAGIAGFILSIGMAVDANILIFERMKEELRLGRTLGAAIEAGFNRAWDSIRDSNFSTLITCAILYYFGSGLIRGFALTLALGVVVSMFTAIVVTRTFLRVLLSTGVARMPALFGVGGVAVPVEPAKRAPSRPDPNGFLPAAN